MNCRPRRDTAAAIDGAAQHVADSDRGVAQVERPTTDVAGDPQLCPNRIGGRAAVQQDRPIARKIGLEYRQCALITPTLHADAAVVVERPGVRTEIHQGRLGFNQLTAGGNEDQSRHHDLPLQAAAEAEG
jgi:hypothetical protein